MLTSNEKGGRNEKGNLLTPYNVLIVIHSFHGLDKMKQQGLFRVDFPYLFRKTCCESSHRDGVEGSQHRFLLKVKVSHSLIAVGAVGVRVPLYLGHS